MVFVSAIYEEVARLTGREVATIRQMARHLREDGQLSQKGHGRGAAHATPLDAARLLIGGMVPDSLKKSSAAVQRFGSLVSIVPQLVVVENIRIHPQDRFEEALRDVIAVIGLRGTTVDWDGFVELNLTAGRANLGAASGMYAVFDGPSDLEKVPAVQVVARVEISDLLQLGLTTMEES